MNYSASRASEKGVWDPSATSQGPDMLVHTLEAPVAQNSRPADVFATEMQGMGLSKICGSPFMKISRPKTATATTGNPNRRPLDVGNPYQDGPLHPDEGLEHNS